MDAPRAPRRARGIGTRGPGESQIETDRRLARDRIAALRRRLRDVSSTRATQRAERERAHLPTVALAGYTNAGKSTLLNALTGAEVGVRDRLFHTLDPTTRTLRLDGRTYLLTDTVGFIRKLPHQLVDAFGATLEETKLADLLLHVVDACAPTRTRWSRCCARSTPCSRRSAPAEQPRLLVLNKADAIDEDRRRELEFRHPDAVLVSALTGEGLGELATGSRPSSSARCATSSCSSRSRRARRSPSCTRSPATSSARTRRRACASARGCPTSSPTATTATRSTATAGPG